MRKKDESRPATKGDVKLILTHLSLSEKRLTKVEKRMDNLETRMEINFDEYEERIKRYIDVKNELLVHDIVGAMKDDVQGVKDQVHDHEFRIQVLEHKH